MHPVIGESRVWAWRTLVVAVLGMMSFDPSMIQAQEIIVFPRSGSVASKAPLAWREGDLFYLMNMTTGPREANGDWTLQPMVTVTWGQPSPIMPSGWSTKRLDEVPLGKINAFGGAGPTDGTNSVDWGDGSFLRVSAQAGRRYGLPEGSILYSTRLNTSILANPRDPKAGLAGYGTRYRIMVFLSTDNARSWSSLPAVALAGKSPADSKAVVGLWSNFLFERGDGTIQIYYDTEEAAWLEPGGQSQGEQWLAMQTLVPGQPLRWSGQPNAIIVDGNQPGRPRPRTGMASVSEKSPGGLMIATTEDVDYYDHPSPQGPPDRCFQGVVRVLKSFDGGQTWGYANTLRLPRGFNNLAPWHIRDRISGDLIIAFRSDVGRMRDPNHRRYDPSVSVKQPGDVGNVLRVLGNIDVYRSSDDGLNWRPLDKVPGLAYTPGGEEFSFDPGVTEIRLTDHSANLIFQWGQFIDGPGDQLRTWVQTVTIRK